jgi:hypothetical protein
MSSSETATCAGAGFLRETVLRGFELGAVFRVVALARFFAGFGATAGLTFGSASSAFGLTTPSRGSLAGLMPETASLVFFELFAIYFCF